jgi:AraC family transcriptional regulator
MNVDHAVVHATLLFILGHRLEHLRIEMIRFHRGMRLEEHSHAWGCLHWIRGGLYKERDATATRCCGSGTLLYKAPEVVHENRFDEGDAWALRLQIPWHLLPAPAREPSSSIRVLAPLARALLAAVWAEHQIADGPSELAVAALTDEIVNQVVVGAGGARSVSIRAAEDARRAISDRWNDTISFTDLAGQLGVDRSTLARSFRCRFGMSMGAFQRGLRVAHALCMLDDGASVVAVALDAGFADQAHFTRAFKAVVGVPPALWRHRTHPPGGCAPSTSTT